MSRIIFLMGILGFFILSSCINDSKSESNNDDIRCNNPDVLKLVKSSVKKTIAKHYVIKRSEALMMDDPDAYFDNKTDSWIKNAYIENIRTDAFDQDYVFGDELEEHKPNSVELKNILTNSIEKELKKCDCTADVIYIVSSMFKSSHIQNKDVLIRSVNKPINYFVHGSSDGQINIKFDYVPDIKLEAGIFETTADAIKTLDYGDYLEL